MLSSFAASVRITSRQSAIWRTCAECGALAPLPPDENRCPDCCGDGASRPSSRRPRSRGRN